MNPKLQAIDKAELRRIHRMLTHLKLGIALDFHKEWMRVVEAHSYGLLTLKKHHNGQLLIEGLTADGERFLARGLNP